MLLNIIPKRIISENVLGFDTCYYVKCDIPVLNKTDAKVLILQAFSFSELEKIIYDIQCNIGSMITINVNNYNDLTMVPILKNY